MSHLDTDGFPPVILLAIVKLSTWKFMGHDTTYAYTLKIENRQDTNPDATGGTVGCQ